jgi:restriction endonuclease S subunit
MNPIRLRFDEFAEMVNDRVDDPANSGLSQYVGLEHLDPGVIRISRTGSTDDVGTTKFRFRAEDVIYARRNPHLRKAGLADFDGIASAHSLVLRAVPTVCTPEYLANFLISATFSKRAMAISVGSLSRTINWRDLRHQEFDLPALEEQLRIVEVMRAVDREIEAAQTLQAKTQESLEALVQETFLSAGRQVMKVRLDVIVEVRNEVLRGETSEKLAHKVGLEHLETANVDLLRWDSESSGDNFTRIFRAGDVLFGKLRAYQRKVAVAPFNGLCAGDILVLRPRTDALDSLELAYLLSSPTLIDQALRFTVGSTLPRVKVDDLLSLEVYVPSSPSDAGQLTPLRRLHDLKKCAMESVMRAKLLRTALLQELIG